MASRIYPMGLILSSILLLAVPGILYNNFSSSGLAPSFSLTCPGYPDFTCTNSASTGCQLDPSSCALNTGSISFLNQQSPFTDIVRGNINGFIPFITGQGVYPSRTIYQVTPFGSSGLVSAKCLLVYNGNSSTTYGYSSTSCGQTDSRGNVLPATQTIKLSPAPYFANQTAVPFYSLGVSNSSTYPPTSSYLQSANCIPMIGFFFAGTNQAFVAGCQYYHTSGGVTTYWYYTVELNATAAWTSHAYKPAKYSYAYCNTHSGLNTTGTTPDCPPIYAPVIAQPESWDVYDCDQEINFQAGTLFGQNLGAGPPYLYNPLATPPIIPQCNAIIQSITNYTTNTSASGILGSVLLWLASIFLFIVGTGVNFSATGSIFGSGVGVGAGANRQGTKFAQILGLSLMLYVPLYSEFGTWFTSGTLPNGLDGTLGIVSIVVTALLFIGVVWQATQD